MSDLNMAKLQDEMADFLEEHAVHNFRCHTGCHITEKYIYPLLREAQRARDEVDRLTTVAKNADLAMLRYQLAEIAITQALGDEVTGKGVADDIRAIGAQRDEARAALAQERLANVGLNDLVGKLGVLSAQLTAERDEARAQLAAELAKPARPCRGDGCRNEALFFHHLCAEHHLSLYGYMPEDLPIAPTGCKDCSARPGQRHRSGAWCVRDFVPPAAAPHVEVGGRTAAQVAGGDGEES